MSSYDDAPLSSDEVITPNQFKESMRLVRLQIAIPISVLIAMGANLVCALAIKPGLRESLIFYEEGVERKLTVDWGSWDKRIEAYVIESE